MTVMWSFLLLSLLMLGHGIWQQLSPVLATEKGKRVVKYEEDPDFEDQLIIDLFGGYNSLIRPSNADRGKNQSITTVKFGVALILLINLDEKNQVMQTNLWLTMRWFDANMHWNPAAYGGIRSLRIPPDKVWLPDIVLFNNADGNYEVSFDSNVVIEHTGQMLWVPPAIYKSSCTIDVQFFPFDEQVCSLVFGSWTYSRGEVLLESYSTVPQVELNDYSFSGIWDVVDVPGHLVHGNSRMSFDVKVRRKTLFYTVILIIPTVLMAVLSMMVFYLPADASEKITLSISILLALVVFLLLVSKILPPTSKTIPLMAKYLLLTFVTNIVSILVTVVIINIYFRGPGTHDMPSWVKFLMLKLLPEILLMRKPKPLPPQTDKQNSTLDSAAYRPLSETFIGEFSSQRRGPHQRTSSLNSYVSLQSQLHHHPNCALSRQPTPSATNLDRFGFRSVSPLAHTQGAAALDAVGYLAKRMRTLDQNKQARDQWKYVAMVIDRLLLYVFFGITLGSTFGILLSAPNVFESVDQKAVIQRIKARLG